MITVAEKCLLYSETDPIAAWPRNDAKCQQATSRLLFDHLVGCSEQYGWHVDA